MLSCWSHNQASSYTAIVRPIIEYAATVWDPTSQGKIKALENIQRRAARFDYLQCVAMKLVVGMNSGLGLIGCHSNDCAFARVEAHLLSIFPILQ
jgi:hypothetical protein